MANSYITLGGYKFTVDMNSPGRTMPEDMLRVTLNDTVYKSMGNFRARWTYGVQMKFTADVGYGSRAQFLTLMQDRTVAGQLIAFTDEYNVNQGNVMMVSSTYPIAITSADLDNAAAIYRSTIVLIDV